MASLTKEKKARRIAFFLVKHKDYRAGVVAGLRRFIEERGGEYTLLPCENWSLAQVQKQEFDGIVANIQDETLGIFHSLEKPVVKIGGRRDFEGMPSVQMDDESVGEVGAAHLLGRGFRHFGFLTIRKAQYAKGRWEGFRRRLAAFASPCTALELDEDDELELSNAPVLDLWIHSLEKPAAVMAASDLLGRRLIEFCRKKKLRVPHDIAVLGYNNGRIECELAEPQMSSVPQEREALGYAAMEALAQILEGGGAPSKRTLLARSAVSRESTRIFRFEDAALNTLVKSLHAALREGETTLQGFFENEKTATPFARYFAAQSASGDLTQEAVRAQVLLAESLLRQTTLSDAKICRLCGFKSAAHFEGLFKLGFERTPQAHRALYHPSFGAKN